jgi:ATP-dependent RNA helicase DeaD
MNSSETNSTPEAVAASEAVAPVALAAETPAAEPAVPVTEAAAPVAAIQHDPFALPENVVEPENPLPDATFEGLDDLTREALTLAGWTRLLPVQAKTIPYMNAGRDMIIQSKTGSGKTGAFLIPLIQILESDHAYPQALILTPTRELCLQIEAEFRRLTPNRALRCVALYGGVKYEPQIAALKEGVHLVVATPGRLLDLMNRRLVDFKSLRDLVMDEADEMLSMGFYPDMKEIQRSLPKAYCCTLFSATMPEMVKSLAREFQTRNRGFLSLSRDHISTDALDHSYFVVDPMDKDAAVLRLLEVENPESCIIFCNMKRDVEYLGQYLRVRGLNPGLLSGDVSQKDRTKTMKAFREKAMPILIATDVAARGIDISHVTHVILHDHPDDSEVYVHRSGRTARAGRKGKAISIVTQVEEIAIKRTGNQFGIVFERVAPPTQEIADQHVLTRLVAELERELRHLAPSRARRIERFVHLAEELAKEERVGLMGLLLAEHYSKLIGGIAPADMADAADVVAAEAEGADGQDPHQD